MLSDIEISRGASIKHIREIAEALHLDTEADIDLYGRYKAKLTESCLTRLNSDGNKSGESGKLILVTAMNPTQFGEGKTTMSIGLGQALHSLGHKTVLALREPSLGPVFGIKGGAAGGGYSQVIPMEDINLHFTGDFHAITSANNLLCAMIDNHIHQGNPLGIDISSVTFSRCMDMNDRALRETMIGLGKSVNGVPRKDGFRITAASEIMAVFCLARTLAELKTMLGNITIGYNLNGAPVFARDLKAEGAMCVLLKEAFAPNLVQTLEGTPVMLHGGPFANIAHGCNSIRATATALKLADYVVTEAGFGADLGAEKFFDIKCRKSGLSPDAVVLVVTIRAIKHNGGGDLTAGFENILAHFENLKKFNTNPVVVLNKFHSDTTDDISTIQSMCEGYNIPLSVSTAFADGGKGSVDLAEKVVQLCQNSENAGNGVKFAYDDTDDVRTKVEKVAQNIYGAASVAYSDKAEKVLAQIDAFGYLHLPICMAKTQYSLSDNPKLLNRPHGFELSVKDIIVQTGAGFIVVLTGDIMIMPGFPVVPNAEIIDIDENGNIVNLS